MTGSECKRDWNGKPLLGSPFYVNLLPPWLTNHAYDQLFRQDELEHNILNVTKFVPGNP